MDRALPFAATEDHEIELAVVDLGVARAFWEGVPTARLLARIRLDRDERDLVALADRASGDDVASSTWDTLLARLLGGSPPSCDRVKRAVARHGRAAAGEGPISASDAVIAALVHVLLSSSDSEVDGSPAEGAADRGAIDASVVRACGRLDARLQMPTADRRAAPFEACLHVAAVATPMATPLSSIASLPDDAFSLAALYPWGDDEVPTCDRHALLLDRNRVAASPLLMREMAVLAPHHGELVVFATREVASAPGTEAVRGAPPRAACDAQAVPASSWLPADLRSFEAVARLAAALERGAVTAPRARSVILAGGDETFDAIGAEMLEVAAHPFASAVFADVLGRVSRTRDVVRLVSYFAIAPDLPSAAHALAVCTAPDLPTVLHAWLESSLPADGTNAPAPPPGSDPDLSASARLQRAIAALAPYPHLHAAVAPLLRRATAHPPPLAAPADPPSDR